MNPLLRWAAEHLGESLDDCAVCLRGDHGHRHPGARLAHFVVRGRRGGVLVTFSPHVAGEGHLRDLHERTCRAALLCPDLVPQTPRWHEEPPGSLVPLLVAPGLTRRFCERLVHHGGAPEEARDDALAMARAAWLLLPRSGKRPAPEDVEAALVALRTPLLAASRGEGAKEDRIREVLSLDALPECEETGLFHGDFRGANLLLEEEGDGGPRIALVDWEFAEEDSPWPLLDPLYFALDLNRRAFALLAGRAPARRQLLDLSFAPLLRRMLARSPKEEIGPRPFAALVGLLDALHAVRHHRLFPHEPPERLVDRLLESWAETDEWSRSWRERTRSWCGHLAEAALRSDLEAEDLRARVAAERNRADMHRAGHDAKAERIDELHREVDAQRHERSSLEAKLDDATARVARITAERDAATERLAGTVDALARSRRAWLRSLGLDEANAVHLDGHAFALVEELAAGHRGDLNHLSTVRGHLDVERFRGWFAELDLRRPVSGARALVLGCESGPELAMLGALGASVVVGLDLDEAPLRLASHRCGGRGGAVRGDAAVLPFAPESFDLVVLSHVLEHVREPMKVLSEAWRQVAPGGCLYVEVPNRWTWREQHTGIPLVAWFSPPWRERICRLLAHPRLPVSDAFRRLVLGMVGDFHTFDDGDLRRLVDGLRPAPDERSLEGRLLHERAPRGTARRRITAWRAYLRRS